MKSGLILKTVVVIRNKSLVSSALQLVVENEWLARLVKRHIGPPTQGSGVVGTSPIV